MADVCAESECLRWPSKRERRILCVYDVAVKGQKCLTIGAAGRATGHK
jgi:hypothetical protein